MNIIDKDFAKECGFIVVLMLLAFGMGFLHGTDTVHEKSEVSPEPIVEQTLEDQHTLHDLIEAIEQVESNGDPDAVGDNGKAVGILQIHPITVRDANRILGRNEFDLEDRKSVHRSREIFRVITDHYSKGDSFETIARRWNGGPDGDEQKATEPYWDKVEAELTN